MSGKDNYIRKVPLTEEQLRVQRKESIESAKEHGMEVAKFTCDGCNLATTCKLVFDLYNTDGDCLLEK